MLVKVTFLMVIKQISSAEFRALIRLIAHCLQRITVGRKITPETVNMKVS